MIIRYGHVDQLVTEYKLKTLYILRELDKSTFNLLGYGTKG